MRPARHPMLFAMSACALCVASLVAGCSARQPQSPAGAPAPIPTATSEPTVAPPADAPTPGTDFAVKLVPAASGFKRPLFVTHAGDGSGRLFVVEQGGRVWAVRGGKKAGRPFLDVSRRITTGGERGLLGLAFAPGYASTGVFYVNYTNTGGDTRVVRYVADDPASDTPKLSAPKAVLGVVQPYANHNGGCIIFQPGTERLWVGMGDGGSAGDPHGNAQNPRALLGKMLVLDFAKGASPKPEIVERGVRNPWRFSFDRQTHDVWIGDVGQGDWEEIDVVALDRAQGVNWGWPLWEGNHPYPGDSNPSKKGYAFPITEYSHDVGRSVTGGYVYRGADYPELSGAYFYGDFETGFVATLRREDASGVPLAKPQKRVVVAEGRISPSSFGEDERGELYVCDYGGTIYQVTAVAE